MRTSRGLALAAAMVATAGGTAAQEYTLRVSSPAPLSDVDPVSAWMRAFEAGVEARSDGRIDVQLYPASQLGPIPATVEGVAMGTIEMTLPVVGFFSRIEPRFSALEAGGLFDDEAHMMRALAEAPVAEMLAGFGEAAGVEALMVLPAGQSLMVSPEAVTDTAGFEGLKLRTGGASEILIAPMRALGASPVPMPLGEALPGLQTGTIDAATINLPVAVGFQFADVAPHGTYLPGTFVVIGGVMNRGFLAGLGAELEAVVREEARAAVEPYLEKLASAPTALEGAWRAAGGEVHRIEDEAAFLSAVREASDAVVAADARASADYEVLRAAAEATR